MDARRSLRAILLFSAWSLVIVLSGPAQAADLKEGVEQLASAIAKSVPEGKQLRVAVTDFPDLQGVTSDLGRYIAERLTTRLIQDPRKFRVVERRRLGQVLAELKFGMSDLVDPAKAKQLGRMVGVEALVVGSLSDLGNIVEVDARIIEIETSNMLVAATTSISKDETVKTMQERGREMPAPSSPRGSIGGPATMPAPPVTLGTVKYQDFPQLRVEVVSLRRLSGGRIELVLNYVNKTSKDYVVSIPTWCSQTQLMSDDSGNDYRCENFVGIGYYHGPNVDSSGLTLPAGGSARASLRFDPPRQMGSQGSRFSFNGQHFLLSPVAAGRPRLEATYTISILDIEPR